MDNDTQDMRDHIVLAALDAGAQYGWDNITFVEIAHEACMPLAELQRLFVEKTDILMAYGRMIDFRLGEVFSMPRAPMESCRERLFDIYMERFDILNEKRDGVLSVISSMSCDPKRVMTELPFVGRSAAYMLDLCGLETNGLRGALRVSGALAIYMHGLHVWKSDESADMAKVMACLDADLMRAEKIADFLSV